MPLFSYCLPTYVLFASTKVCKGEAALKNVESFIYLLVELDFKEILFFPSFVLLMYFISNFYGNKKENFKMLEDEGGCEGGDGVKRKLLKC